MIDLFHDYMHFYAKFAVNWWNTVGPVEYVSMLTLVGVVGYWTMLNGSKRLG